MAKMTRYKRPTAQTMQLPNVDFAGLRESARMGQVISRQVDKMSAFLEKQAQTEAEFAAGEIVRERGSEAATDIRAAGGPKNYMEQQVYQSGMRIASAELETSAIGEINRVLFEAETKHYTPAQLQAELSDISDGFPAALSEIDGNVAGLLKSKLEGHIAEAQTKYMGIHSKYVAQQEQGRALLGLQAREDLALQTIGLPVDAETKGAAFEAHIADTAQFLRDKNFDEKYISKWILDTRKKGTIESHLGDFNRLGSLQEKQDYLEKLQATPPKGLSRDDTRTLISALRADLTNTNKIYAAEVSAVKDVLSDQKTIMTKGGVPSTENLARVEARIAALPETVRGTLLDDVNILKARASQMSVFRQLPPQDLEVAVNELSQGLKDAEGKDVGGKGIDTRLEAEMLSDAKGLLTTMSAAVKADPISWAMQTEQVKVEPIRPELMVLAANGDANAIGEMQRVVDSRIQNGKIQSRRLGAPGTFILTKQESNFFAETYQQANEADKLLLLQSINKFFGSSAIHVFDQLKDIDPVLGHVGGLVELGLPDNAGLAVKGFNLIENKVDYEFDKTLANTAFDTMVGRAFGGDMAAKASARQTAEAIYTEMARARNTLNTYDEDIWKQAINLAAGFNRFDRTGGIDMVRDKPTLLPNGITGEDVDKVLDTLTVDDIAYLSGIDVPQSVVNTINTSDNVYPVAMQDGKYALAFDSAEGVPTVYEAQGKDGTKQVIYIDIKKYMGLE